MKEKPMIKIMFEEAFDMEDMRHQILQSYEEKKQRYTIRLLRYALPVCMIVFFGIVMTKPLSQALDTPTLNEHHLIVNTIDQLGATRIDADIKDISSNNLFVPWIEGLEEDITIPHDLNQLHAYGIYTKNQQTMLYDILNCYVYTWFNEEADRSIHLSFSDKNRPVRDYYFSEEGAKVSSIGQHELTIYQYEELYFTEFQYQGSYFDIETSHITFEELTALLESILQ